MWPDTGFSGFTLFGLFKKTNSYWKETVRTVVFYGPVSKEPNHFSVSFYEKVMMGIFFFVFGIAVYEVRERESIKERRH